MRESERTSFAIRSAGDNQYHFGCLIGHIYLVLVHTLIRLIQLANLLRGKYATYLINRVQSLQILVDGIHSILLRNKPSVRQSSPL